MTGAPESRRTEGRDVVVIGASAGGVEALKQLVARLDPDLTAAVLIVLHVSARGTSVLPEILSRAGPVAATHAVDGQPLRHGHIVVAPADSHLLVQDGSVLVTRGPRENGHRPAIDPLFRTAAQALGPRLVGVILSGTLDDGTAGLGLLREAGGLAVVQDPDDALYPGMPRNAIKGAGADYVLPVHEIARLLSSLTPPSDPPVQEQRGGTDRMNDDPDRQDSADIVREHMVEGELTRFTCPECNGSLWEIREGTARKLRCRVGHAFTENAFLLEQATALESALWTAVTTLEEKADFSRRLSRRFERDGQQFAAARYREQEENAIEQARAIRRVLKEVVSPEASEERRAS